MKKAIYVFSSLLLLVIAHAQAAKAQPLPQGKGALRVMTYNVYQGTNFTAVLTADPNDPNEFLLAVGTEFSQVRATNPPARMQAVARQIVAAAPTLVSLQEVSTWSSGPFNPLTGCGPLTVEFDMLQELLDALAAEGVHYEVAVQAPMFAFPPFPGLIPSTGFFCAQLSNYVVILARTDINQNQFQWNNEQFDRFDAILQVPVPGGTLPVPRAWASLDVEWHGKPFRFIAAHLESGETPDIVEIRQQQGEELRDGPANTSLSLIIAFDSNARADPSPPDPTYTDFVAAGYNDVWSELAPDDPGFTWGQSPTVDNPVSQLSERIDLILTLGNFNAQRVALFGATTDSMTPEGLWPSDHVGVAAQLGIPGKQIALEGGEE